MRSVSFPVSAIVLLAALGIASASVGAQTRAQTRTPAVDIQRAAADDSSLRVIISVARRTLWVVTGPSDTLLKAPVAVGSQRSLAYGGHRWTFKTPSGINTVLSKEEHPVWVPPDWHFVEVARQRRLSIVWLHGDTTVGLSNGSSVVMHDLRVQLETGGSVRDFGGSEIVVNGTMFVPPVGSPNRRFEGQLGEYRLLLGDGVGIHGTPDARSVGHAVTHGCMRLHDDDLAWVYDHISIGTRVYIY